MKYLSIVLFFAMICLMPLSGCDNDELVALNDNPTAALEVDWKFLLSQGQVQAAENRYINGRVHLNLASGLIQQMATLQIGGERGSGDKYMRHLDSFNAYMDRVYDTALKTIAEIIRQTGPEGTSPNLVNLHQVAQVLYILPMHIMTDLYGNVPYSEANRGVEGIFFPKYDDQESIYKDMLAKLETAANTIGTGPDEIGNADLIYGGDYDKWKKLANSLMLRLAMRISIKGNYPINLTEVENVVELTINNDNSQKNYFSKEVNNSSFGNLTGSFITAFAYANGYKIIDLANGEVLKEETGLGGLGPYFGVAGATQNPPGNDSPAMIVLAGANGFVLDRFDQSDPIEFDGTTFDVFPAGGDPISNVVTHVLPGAGVGFFVYNDEDNQYVAADVGFPLSLFGDVQLISAYMHDDVLSDDTVPQPRGNFLVLSRENESGVFLVKWDGSNPVRAIDNIGFDPRRLRCIEDGTESNNLICVASIFGHNRLGIMSWDGENEPVLTDFADLDAGPVGIDLRNLPNGNIAVVSTGFDNNTINETVLMPNGRVQSNSSRPVLDGCESPGHAIYIEDSEGFKILATCYNSGSYMIIDSEL